MQRTTLQMRPNLYSPQQLLMVLWLLQQARMEKQVIGVGKFLAPSEA